MLIKFTQKVNSEQCNTHLAANSLPLGSCISVSINHIATTSAMIKTMPANTYCTTTLVENNLFNLSTLPLPNSKVINRLIAADNALDKIPNIVTIPPTT